MTKKNTEEKAIDAVILWVDGSDENHKAKMLPFVEDKNLFQSKKFRTRFDQVNEIKYTVDSILKFASFIRHIYIVTDEQIPDFLNKENGKDLYQKVSIIDHKIIFAGYEDYLPTFNNRPIETCIYRIPNLSEHFIYFNDDFFLINETKPSDFFINDHPVLRGKWLEFDKEHLFKKNKKNKAGHKTAQQKAARLIGFNKYYNFRHTPHPLRKSTFENYFKENEEVFLNNIKHRLRESSQFTPQGLANHIEIKNKTCVLKEDLKLIYFRSYKKPLLWYKLKLKMFSDKKLFLGLQSLDLCPPNILNYILNWLGNRIK